MSILKLRPSGKDYVWGGQRLREEYHKDFDLPVLAETWEVSCHPDGPSYIENGLYRGKTLQDYIDIEGNKVLGTNCQHFMDFPVLIKFIDARDNLSIQVHPDDLFALQNEGQNGKTEVWYVVEAEENAVLYCGFKKEVDEEEFIKRVHDETFIEVLNEIPVQKGDVIFIEAGTIHALGKGILIAEIQQNSNVTYRVYDYGRADKSGKKRDLHLDKALLVTNRIPMTKQKNSYPHIAKCEYFTVDKVHLDGAYMKSLEGEVTEESFANILILDGEGTIYNGDDKMHFRKGDSYFLPAGSGKYRIEGCCEALLTSIR